MEGMTPEGIAALVAATLTGIAGIIMAAKQSADKGEKPKDKADHIGEMVAIFRAEHLKRDEGFRTGQAKMIELLEEILEVLRDQKSELAVIKDRTERR